MTIAIIIIIIVITDKSIVQHFTRINARKIMESAMFAEIVVKKKII